MLFKAEGYYSLSAFSCIEVMVSVEGISEYAYARMRMFGVGTGRVYKHKLYFSSRRGAYFVTCGMRIYLDEVMKIEDFNLKSL